MDKNEDISIEQDESLDDSVVAEEHAGDALKKLKEKVKKAEEKAKEYLDGWQRDRADIANARKRDEESRKAFMKFSTEGFVMELIPVLDSFDMALAHGSQEILPVQKQLFSILKSHGLEVSDPLGETFDPQKHESVGVLATDKKGEDNKILEVMQKGYIMHGRIIRPAKVRVGEFNS